MSTTSSFRFGELGQVHLAFGQAALIPGVGAHLLTLPANMTATWLGPDDPRSNATALLTGTVFSDHRGLRWITGLQPGILTLRGYQAEEKVEVSLSDEQLIALERSRGKDHLSLVFNLQVTLLGGPPDVHPVTREQVRMWIERAKWHELLDQAGTEVGIVLRVPSPLTDSAEVLPVAADDETAASLAQATARLRQARGELRDHRWEHCVATCRKVLENVDRLVTILPPQEAFTMPPDGRNQEQRWAAIYHDTKRMTHGAHHDNETAQGFTWSRADAEAILAATAGLLLRFTATM